METLSDLIEQSTRLDQDKADYLAGIADITFDQQARIVIPDSLFNAVTPLEMTDWALRQACEKLGPPPAEYMRVCPPPLRATNLNHWRESGNGKSWFVRADGDKARAVLTQEYTPVANTRVLEMTQELLGNTPYNLVHPFLDADTLHVKISVADTKDGHYAVGAYIGNGEIGNHAVRVWPFIQRHACTNSILYTDGGFEQRHYKVTPAFIFGALKEKIGQAIGMASEMLDQIVRAEAEHIPDLADVIADLCKQKGLSQPVHDLILIGTEGNKTRFGLVNGLSFAAHQIDDIEHTIELEALAGAVLMGQPIQPLENSERSYAAQGYPRAV
jgi:hypothetical protein